MSDETPRLKLAQLASALDMTADTWNEALAQLDAVVDLCLLGQYVNTPPASPADGDAYLVGGAPTGAWSGYPYKIATCIDGGWRFQVPFNGLRAYVAPTGGFMVYKDGAWTEWNALVAANEVPLASAATCDLGAASSLFVQITGTTAITSFGTATNKLRFVRFAGALTLTHNAASLVLLGGASRTTAAGDCGVYVSDASGNWRERAYARASCDPGDMATRSGAETFSNKTFSGATLFPGGVITASGSLGLGIAAPQTALHVVDQSGVASRGISNDEYFSGAHSAIAGFRKARGSLAAPAAVTNGDYCGTFNFFLYDGTAFRCTATFGARVTGTVGTNAVPTDLFFSTSGGADDVDPYTNGHVRLKLLAAGGIVPGSDNAQNLGAASARWGTIFAGTGTINTSGAAAKTDVRPLSAPEIAVAGILARNIRLFRFAEAVDAKGEDARLHAGSLYEDVVAAFAAQGLDPLRYGVVCRDRAMTRVTRTRTIRRARTRPVSIERDVVTVIDGKAVLTSITDTIEEVVQQALPLVDAGGMPILDDDGRPRTHLVPVLEEVEETYAEEVPDTDQTGAPKWLCGLRYDELAQFIIAGLAARLAAGG